MMRPNCTVAQYRERGGRPCSQFAEHSYTPGGPVPFAATVSWKEECSPFG